jgi:tungstate transport system ATP-binding protein
MTGDSCLQLEEVTQRYGDSFSLDVKQLEVRSGEVLCIVGPTGAGKSTLLRLLSGLEMPTSGDVSLDGEILLASQVPLATRRRLTMVFQQPLLLSRTVRNNLAYCLRLRGSNNKSEERVNRVIEQFGLVQVAAQASNTLSGGQRQLVAIARALLVEPEVLLLDEPTANLDPASVALVEELLARDHQRRGTTVIWCTHNLFQARRVSDRTALLFDGELIEVAATDEFFESPCDSRTADFVNGKTVY